MDLSAVERFTSGSLLVLRAIMDAKSRALHTHVGGNLPDDPTVASEFKASGFFSGFAIPPADLPEPKGLMLKKSNLKSARARSFLRKLQKSGVLHHLDEPICSRTRSRATLVRLRRSRGVGLDCLG